MARYYSNANDLITFSRGSSGTALRRVGYGDELVTNGDFATDSDWTKGTGWTISGGVASYSGGAGVAILQDAGLVSGKIYEIKFDISSLTSGGFSVRCGFGDQSEIFSSVGTHTVNLTCGSNQYIYVVSSSSTNGSIDNISVKEVIFDRATDDLVLFNHPDDIPRIEYAADGSLKGLLIEEERSNLVTYSEDFSQWTIVNGSLGSSASSPSGLLDAAKVVPTTSNTQHRLDFVTTSTAADHTFSVYAKPSGYSGVWLRLGSLTAQFDVTAGTIYQSGGSTTANIQNAGNGWYRVSISGTAAANDTARINVTPTGAASDFAGDGTSGILIYGAQLEQGSFATSYIPTSGSQKTRDPDIASIPVSAFGYNQTAGTVVVDFATLATFGSRDNNDGVFSLRDSSADGDDLVQAFITPTDNLKAQVISGGSSLFSTTILADIPEQNQTKAVIGFTSGSYAASVDGGAAQSLSTSTTYPVAGEITELAIGEISINGVKQLNGHIKSLSYFPRRLTDAQLQKLTG